jgi:glycosyltransferase involved in cell wall biosynthesis
MTLARVLDIEPRSESLEYRWHLDRVGPRSLLEWWVDAASRSSAVGHTYVMCRAEPDAVRVGGRLAGRPGVTIFTPRQSSLSPALIELARNAAASHVALVPPGYILAPRGLLDAALLHHTARKNNFTTLRQFCPGVDPVIFDSDLLERMEAYLIPGTAHDPVYLLARLASLDCSQGDDLPLDLKCIPFDPRDAYLFDQATLPASVDIDTPRDVEVLRRVLARARAEKQPEDRLRALEIWRGEKGTLLSHPRQTATPVVVASTEPPSPSRRRRVLYISNPSAFYGAEATLCDLVNGVNPERFRKFALVAAAGIFASRLEAAGALVRCAEEDFGTNTPQAFLYTLSVLREVEPDVVHLNGWGELPSLCAALSLGIPVVQHAHTFPPSHYGAYLGVADAVIAVSRFVTDSIVRLGVPEEKVHLIRNAVDPSRFRPCLIERTRARDQFGIPRNAKVVLTIARFAPQKRHDVLLRAAAVAKRSVSPLHVALVGEPIGPHDLENLDAVRAQAQALGLSDCISWLGFLPDVRPIHAAADVLVLSSDHEALGRCVVEAMAMGLPSIVSDSGGSREIVRDGETGLVVPSGDAGALAVAMSRVLTDGRLSTKLASACRLYAETNLAVKPEVEHLMQIYEAVMASKSRVPANVKPNQTGS